MSSAKLLFSIGLISIALHVLATSSNRIKTIVSHKYARNALKDIWGFWLGQDHASSHRPSCQHAWCWLTSKFCISGHI
jgi:hypothetical protein